MMSLESQFNGAARAPCPRRSCDGYAANWPGSARNCRDDRRIANAFRISRSRPRATRPQLSRPSAWSRPCNVGSETPCCSMVMTRRLRRACRRCRPRWKTPSVAPKLDRTAAQKPASSPASANDRGRQRQRQKLEDELRDIDVAFEELQRAADALGGMPAEVSPDESPRRRRLRAAAHDRASARRAAGLATGLACPGAACAAL